MFSNDKVRFLRDPTEIEAYKQKHIRTAHRLGYLTVHHFRNDAEQDYIYTKIEEDEMVCHGLSELCVWLSGQKFDDERERALTLANRTHGSFDDEHGWRPMSITKDEPNSTEQEWFIAYETARIDEEWDAEV